MHTFARHARLLSALVLVAACEAAEPAGGTESVEAGPALPLRLRGAERVVVGTVTSLRSAFGTNEHGDRLILSRVTLRVEESLRGDAAGTAAFEIEGGTVGDLTLEVSDLPRLAPGDHGVFALRRDTRQRWVPNRRALGILLAPPGLDLTMVRRAEEVSR